MPSTKKLLQAAAGNAGESLYVEDVFSTYLVTGTGTAPAVNNGIDLSGEGGLVWLKKRSAAGSHDLFDTARGANKRISTNTTNAEDSKNLSFTSTGFSNFTLDNTIDYASWTFRKAEKFFDVVTYTGDGTNGRSITHNLGVTPAFMVVKKTSATAEWAIWHQSVNGGDSYGLFTTAAFNTTAARFIWGDNNFYIPPTSTTFTVAEDGLVNTNGATYVAYLFASDAGGFGDDGSENIIKCGSFNGSVEVNLGYEAQWILIKDAGGVGDWYILDTMRGMSYSVGAYIRPNASNAEASSEPAWIIPTATGFRNVAGGNYIYIAIRRPMKTPESGTEVFMPTATSGAAGTQITTGFASDLQITKYRPGSDAPRWADRLRGFAATDADTEQTLYSNGTDAEVAGGDTQNTLWNTGFKIGGTLGGLSVIYYSLKRATGFFDEVCFTQADYTEAYTHNLTVVPEMMIVKRRNNTSNWSVYTSAVGNTKYLKLEDTGGEFTGGVWGNTSPTSTQFTFSGAGINYVKIHQARNGRN
jgi:hypothetical protein